MGGSSKQTVGYRYFAGLMVAIGNRIESLIAIRPDDVKWISIDPEKYPPNKDNANILINEPNLFGGDNKEGGWVGMLDIHVGLPSPKQNEYLKTQIDPDISAYPNLSYLALHGVDFQADGATVSLSPSLNKGFQLVSMSGMMKDFMLWVKRTRVKNDGSVQWYEKNSNGDVVCEIGEHKILTSKIYSLDIPNFLYSFKGLPISKYYNHSEGIFGNTASSAYGGVEDENISTTMFLQPVANELSLFDLVKIEARAVGIVRELEFKLVNVDQYYDLKIEKIGGLNDEKELNISFVCRKTDAFPYVEFFGKGTILIHGSHKYFWQISSRTTALDSYSFTDSQNGVDINPIHKAREIITDKTAMNKSESSVNDANFRAAADRIWEEGLGISWAIQEKSCRDALNEIESHIEGGFRINRQTGLYECILFRDDLLDLDNALKFNESNIKSMNFDIGNIDESISSINVSYYDRELIKNSSFVLYENGLEKTRGFSLSENIDFPYFMNRRNAEIVGNWKLKQLSSPIWKGSFTTGLAAARQINKFDVVKISWKSKNIVDLPVRIMNINLGDGVNNAVSLDFVEVIPYSNIDYSQTHTDPAPPLDTGAAKPNVNTAFEMPYFESVQRFGQTQVDTELANTPEIGYLMASALKPQNNSVNAHLYTDGGSNNFAQMSYASIVDYCPAVELNQEIGYLDTSFVVKNINDSRFAGATVGTWVILNNEIMVFESFNNDSMTMTVKRGALDTVPQKHTGGIIFFSDEFSGFDTTQYILGENVAYQVLTTTPSEIEKLDEAKSKHVIFKSRAIRPYPPANVKINNEYYPTEIDTDLILTWVDRNRLQQTGGDILGYFDGGVTIENGTTYYLKVVGLSMTNEETILVDENIGTVNEFAIPSSSHVSYIIELSSQRDGYSSLQKFKHTVSTKLTAPENLVATFIL